MIRKGDTLINSVTGEYVTFLETATDTGGEYLLLDVTVNPGGFVAAAHVHPFQSERFEIISGEAEFAVGRSRTKVTGHPGDIVQVDPGTPHSFRNTGREPLRFLTEVRPALSFESMLETMFDLAEEGKTNSRGLPNPFRLAVIMRDHFDVVRLPFPPAWMQRTAIAVGGAIGRLLGYRAKLDTERSHRKRVSPAV